MDFLGRHVERMGAGRHRRVTTTPNTYGAPNYGANTTCY